MAPPPERGFPASQLDYNLAYSYIVVGTTCHVLATIVLLARIYSRSRPVWRFRCDDYLICLGYVLSTIQYTLMFCAEAYVLSGERPPTRAISAVKYSARLGTISTPFWAWSIGIVKISIACMLLRFQQSRGWRILLYSLIGLNVLLIAFTGIGNLFQCIPFKGMYDVTGEVKDKKCWGPTMDGACLYVSAAINVLMDIVFSVIPLTFLRKIRRPLKEKIVIGILMALGLVASTLSLAKIVYAAKPHALSDPTAKNILFGMLSCLEVQTAIIAACLPTLRSTFNRAMMSLGLWNVTEMDVDVEGIYGGGSSFPKGPKGQSRLVNLREVHQAPEPLSMSEDQSQNIRLGGTLYRGNSSSNSCSGSSHHPSSRQGSHHDTQDEELDDTHYEMDPKTGRIVCTTQLKVHSSRTHLRDDWVKTPAPVIHDEWERLRIERLMGGDRLWGSR